SRLDRGTLPAVAQHAVRGAPRCRRYRTALVPITTWANCCAPAAERSDVTGLAWSRPTTAPRGVAEIVLLLTSAVPAPGATDTPMPTRALRITLPLMATSRRYLPQP